MIEQVYMFGEQKQAINQVWQLWEQYLTKRALNMDNEIMVILMYQELFFFCCKEKFKLCTLYKKNRFTTNTILDITL